ncbi:MAG TPA: Calx-beta domain-containing protein, partial [Pyrinomonadaceae bacterium]
ATSGVISIPINDDALDEADETFTLNITAVPGIVTQSQTTATILDNDPTPSISIADLNVVEGDLTNNTAFFQVSLSAPSGRTVTVDYATAANTATASDFVPVSGNLTFAPGQTVANVPVQIIGDTLCESDKTFFVNLSNPANATLNDAQALGTIVDNDAPVLVIDASSQRAIALDSVNLVHEPFALNNPTYFGDDKRTRIAIFSLNLILEPGLVVTAQAVDSQQNVYQLPVEFVGTVPSFIAVTPQEPFLTKIVFRLPDGIPTTGDLQVSITTRGKTSNKVLIALKP